MFSLTRSRTAASNSSAQSQWKRPSEPRGVTFAADSHVLYYRGHAGFHPGDALRSALVLQDKNDPSLWLTLRDVFCGLHLQHNTLTVLSGCESGMVSPDRIDEYVGLPSGFLFAGSLCVVSSLWVVNDLSCALLMDRFHHEWHGGKSIAAALHAAQRWLRDDIKDLRQLRDDVLPPLLAKLDDAVLKRQCLDWLDRFAKRYVGGAPFASPAHWAPFAVTGLGYALPPLSPEHLRPAGGAP